MNLTKMVVLWGGAAYLGYIAGIYGMPQSAVGYTTADTAGSVGNLTVIDTRNNAPMIVIVGGAVDVDAALSKAALNATAAVASAGNRAWPTTPYDGAAYSV